MKVAISIFFILYLISGLFFNDGEKQNADLTDAGQTRFMTSLPIVNGYIQDKDGISLGPANVQRGNVIDTKPNPNSQLLLKSIQGSYKLGLTQSLRSVGSEMDYMSLEAYEGLPIEVKSNHVIFKDFRIIEVQNTEQPWTTFEAQYTGKTVRTKIRYIGQLFHEPNWGPCGSAGCNRGLVGHAYIYKFEQEFNKDDERTEPLKFIIVAFNPVDREYNQIFLSTLEIDDFWVMDEEVYKSFEEWENNNFQVRDRDGLISPLRFYPTNFFQLQPRKIF